MRKERVVRLLSQKKTFILLIVIVIVSILSGIFSILLLSKDSSIQLTRRTNQICDPLYDDNIGYRSFSDVTCFPQIDAVYTWVNGSDPTWLADMQFYKSQYRKEHNITDVEDNNSISSNRFRDNDELKYSLRSLEKNAPWIRHIYIVTNGQIPSWLDTSNPKVSIVTHQEIFKNQQALPTFSSPSIEMNLHHIKGLSDYFIYFNDDVFLGSPVTPADFMSLEKGQILYTSWEVPECAEFCNYNQLGNGYCDTRCNNPQCGYDFGDCEDKVTMKTEESVPERNQLFDLVQEDEMCYETCSNGYLGNDLCNEECNRKECGYDGGDCGEIDDHHLSLVFHCHNDELMNTLKLKGFSKQNLKKADYYIEQEYMIETDSYCLARAIVDFYPYYILHLDSLDSSTVTIQSVECLEAQLVLMCKYDPIEQTIFIVLKPSIQQQSFTLHLLALAETTDNIMLFFLIDLLRMQVLPSATIHSLITDHIPPQLPLVSNQRLSSYSYIPSPMGSQMTFLIHMEDPWSDNTDEYLSYKNFSTLLRPNKTISFMRFNNRDKDLIDKPFPLFTGADAQLVFDSALQQISLPTTVFSSEGYVHDVIELKVTKHDVMNTLLPLVANTFNYQHSSYYSFQYWKETRRSYIGLDVDVYEAIRKKPYSRYIRTCNAAFTARGGDFSTKDQLVFWREIFEYYEVSKEHDEFWNLFKKEKTPSIHPFSNIEDISAFNDFFKKQQQSRVVWAVPIIELVTCTINRSKQQFDSTSPFHQFVLRTDETSPTDYILSREVIPYLLFDSASRVIRSGSTGVAIFYDSQSVSNSFKKFGNSVRSQENTMNKPRRLMEYDLWKEEDRLELNKRNIHHLKDIQHRFELNQQNRRLSDSYRDSLIFTNLQLIKLFGNIKRRVPAHMPHFINKHVMAEIEEKLGVYVNKTITHRFREGDDLQYAFLYFHYLIGREEQKSEDFYKQFWNLQLDTNNNGFLDQNEFMTLVSIVYDREVTKENKEKLLQCISPNTTENVTFYEDSSKSLYIRKSFPVQITYEMVMNCSLAQSAIHSTFPFSAHYQTLSDSAIAFQMIDDNVEETTNQLNSVRARQSKFVCINDNITNKTAELSQVIHSFYESFFPIPSSFEKGIKRKGMKERIIDSLMFVVSLRKIPHLLFYCLELGLVILLVAIFSYCKRCNLHHKGIQVDHNHSFYICFLSQTISYFIKFLTRFSTNKIIFQECNHIFFFIHLHIRSNHFHKLIQFIHTFL